MKACLRIGVAGLMLASCAAALATDTGNWMSGPDPLLTGTWDETYGPNGPGQPGCYVMAQSTGTPAQWTLEYLYIPEGETPDVTWEGNIATWVTDYESDLALSGGIPATLALADEPAMWGMGTAFEYVTAVVTAQVDYTDPDNPVYLSGVIDGSGLSGDLTAMFHADLAETYGFRTPGHGGDVTYLELTIIPEPTALALLAVGLLIRRR